MGEAPSSQKLVAVRGFEPRDVSAALDVTSSEPSSNKTQGIQTRVRDNSVLSPSAKHQTRKQWAAAFLAEAEERARTRYGIGERIDLYPQDRSGPVLQRELRVYESASCDYDRVGETKDYGEFCYVVWVRDEYGLVSEVLGLGNVDATPRALALRLLASEASWLQRRYGVQA